MMLSVCQLSGITGIWNCGSQPPTEDISLTGSVSTLNPITTAEITKMAIRGAGTALVKRGKK